MPLDPQAAAVLDLLEQSGLPTIAEMSVPQARAAVQGLQSLQGEPEEVASVQDLTVPGPSGRLPVRIYTPESDEDTLGTLVYFHGGGFVIGNVEIVDRPCRNLANATGCIVASVEYRLAPESQFPAAVDDCYAAVEWISVNAASLGGDPSRVAVAGDSAGGNLAAVVALMARDRWGPPIAFQVLIYPATDLGGDYPSMRENAEGYFLSAADLRWFFDHYLADPDQRGLPYVSPMRADSLAGLPPALVVTAEFDPLRDDGEAYAAALKESGVAVTLSRYDGQLHGLLWLAGAVDRGRDLIAEIGQEVRTALKGA